jgi:hypothetical protein
MSSTHTFWASFPVIQAASLLELWKHFNVSQKKKNGSIFIFGVSEVAHCISYCTLPEKKCRRILLQNYILSEI